MHWIKNNKLVTAGLIVSVIWICGCACKIAFSENFLASAPNIMGDFFAGAFSGLAFLWLFIATMLQKYELQLQRDELKLQRKVSESQAAEAISQGKIFAQQSELIKKQIEVQTAQLENERQRKKLEQTIRVQNLSMDLADKIKIRFSITGNAVVGCVKNDFGTAVSMQVVIKNSKGIECGGKISVHFVDWHNISEVFQLNEFLEVFFVVIVGTSVFAYASKGPFSMDLIDLTVGNLLPYEVIPPEIIEWILPAQPIDL